MYVACLKTDKSQNVPKDQWHVSEEMVSSISTCNQHGVATQAVSRREKEAGLGSLSVFEADDSAISKG